MRKFRSVAEKKVMKALGLSRCLTHLAPSLEKNADRRMYWSENMLKWGVMESAIVVHHMPRTHQEAIRRFGHPSD